jgi:hypothetical protein
MPQIANVPAITRQKQLESKRNGADHQDPAPSINFRD